VARWNQLLGGKGVSLFLGEKIAALLTSIGGGSILTHGNGLPFKKQPEEKAFWRGLRRWE
jgi:hypothetical protein